MHSGFVKPRSSPAPPLMSLVTPPRISSRTHYDVFSASEGVENDNFEPEKHREVGLESFTIE